MKKKQIEKIPYLTLPKTSRKKDVKYIGVTAFKNVAHERHLFVEVYRNSKSTMDIPLVRIVLTKKDFGNYFPETDEWTRQKIETDHYYNQGLLWSEQEDRIISWKQAVKRNILMSENDIDRIKKVCDVKIWQESKWWEYIYQHEDNIVIKARREAENRKYERRRQALKEREENTPELPEQSILSRMDERFFHHKHILFYKKKGSFARIACTKCGGVTDARWRAGVSYDSQFQRWTDEPREGDFGTCPMCGARGEYKCQGKVRSGIGKSTHVFLGQKYKETGMVFRYIEVSKEWQLEEICGNDGPEMYNAREVMSGVEIARGYFEEGKKLQIDYHKHNPYTGQDFWDDCNLYGLSNISVKAAPILPETYAEMKGTMFQYSALREFIAAAGDTNPIDYMERYSQTPQIEMLTKFGLTDVVKELVSCRYGIVYSQYATRPDVFLGINKDKVKLLIEKKGNIKTLEILQMERHLEQNWTEEQIEELAEIDATQRDIEMVLSVMTLQKALNQIAKYAGCEFGTGCSSAVARIKHTATTYFDYLSMRAQLGYDMSNTVYQRPRNLEVAHNKMVAEIDKKQVDRRMLEVAERYPLIRKNYRKLRKRYFFEDENFMIRPARSAEEIVQEGRILHHCVGGDNYLKKHNEQKSIILFLRFKEEQETPYITVEIEGERIVQWYGAHDKKPDEQNMQKWLNAYVTRLKCNRLGVAERTEEEVMQQMLAYA